MGGPDDPAIVTGLAQQALVIRTVTVLEQPGCVCRLSLFLPASLGLPNISRSLKMVTRDPGNASYSVHVPGRRTPIKLTRLDQIVVLYLAPQVFSCSRANKSRPLRRHPYQSRDPRLSHLRRSMSDEGTAVNTSSEGSQSFGKQCPLCVQLTDADIAPGGHACF